MNNTEDNLMFDTFEMHIGDASQMKLLTLRSYFDKLYPDNKIFYSELIEKFKECSISLRFEYTLNDNEKSKFNKDIEKLLYCCGFLTKYENDNVIISWN